MELWKEICWIIYQKEKSKSVNKEFLFSSNFCFLSFLTSQRTHDFFPMFFFLIFSRFFIFCEISLNISFCEQILEQHDACFDKGKIPLSYNARFKGFLIHIAMIQKDIWWIQRTQRNSLGDILFSLVYIHDYYVDLGLHVLIRSKFF